VSPLLDLKELLQMPVWHVHEKIKKATKDREIDEMTIRWIELSEIEG